MLEGESGGALALAGDDQRRDLDDLALTAGGARVALRDSCSSAVVVSPVSAAMTASRACSIAFMDAASAAVLING